jgi:hypothetical protein
VSQRPRDLPLGVTSPSVRQADGARAEQNIPDTRALCQSDVLLQAVGKNVRGLEFEYAGLDVLRFHQQALLGANP